MNALRRRFPGNSWRTTRTATSTPNTVLSTTPRTATFSVTSKACSASRSVNWCHTGLSPCWKVRQKTSPTGSTSRNSRYTSAASRSPHLATARAPALDHVERHDHGQRHDQEDGGHRGGAGAVVALDLAEDLNRRHLRLDRDVSGDEQGRAQLGDRSPERQ